MVEFAPEAMLQALERHRVRYVVIGGMGAVLHGSPLRTRDADVCPAPDDENLESLALALNELQARIRAAGEPEGVPFACDAPFLRQMRMLNLTTRFGDLDLAFEPAGTGGYADLASRAVNYDLGDGLIVPVAALEDIIRSKEAANREKDHQSLPTLRLLLAQRNARG